MSLSYTYLWRWVTSLLVCSRRQPEYLYGVGDLSHVMHTHLADVTAGG